MKLIETTKAVGHVLCHDITVIVKDEKKGVAFKKGHIVREDDIPELLRLGKDHLFIWEKDETMMHEDDAAAVLRDICMGDNMHPTLPSEGKIELIADTEGLLVIDSERLNSVNDIEEIMVATRHGMTPVTPGDKLAGMRVIPLIIKKEKMDRCKQVAGEAPIMNVLPYKPMKVGLITTGNEVFFGRIKDTFSPVIEQKVSEFGMSVVARACCPDDRQMISAELRKMTDEGVDMILTTGGMSVDPDDMTPGAIKEAGTRIVTYGAPVLPGAMMLVGYLPVEGQGEIPVLGLPGCVMFARRTIFDLVLCRIAAGVKIERKDITRMGEGGFCLNCKVCMYPNCGFGK